MRSEADLDKVTLFTNEHAMDVTRAGFPSRFVFEIIAFCSNESLPGDTVAQSLLRFRIMPSACLMISGDLTNALPVSRFARICRSRIDSARTVKWIILQIHMMIVFSHPGRMTIDCSNFKLIQIFIQSNFIQQFQNQILLVKSYTVAISPCFHRAYSNGKRHNCVRMLSDKVTTSETWPSLIRQLSNKAVLQECLIYQGESSPSHLRGPESSGSF